MIILHGQDGNGVQLLVSLLLKWVGFSGKVD